MRYKFNVIVLIAALVLLGVFLFAIAPDPDSSRYENRSMAGRPQLSAGSFFSGKYPNDLEAYLSDNIAFRTKFLSFSSKLENIYGVRMGGATVATIDDGDLGVGMIANPDEAYIDPFLPEVPLAEFAPPDGAGDSDNAASQTQQPQSQQQQQPQQPAHDITPVHHNNHVNPDEPFGIDVHYNPDAVIYGDFYVDASSVNRYIGILNEYRRALPASVRVFCLLVPTKTEFLDEKYKTNSARQDTTIRGVYEKLDGGIITVDAYSRIAARVPDEYLYFRTDHHWTALGAYYAYRAFTDAAGIVSVTIDNYIEHFMPDYIGSYGTGTQDATILNSPDTLYYYQLDDGTTFSQRLFYIPEDKTNLSYMVFMGGDHALLDYTSSNTNGKTLIVIKDSYANAFLPWVSPNYERVIVIDPRQYEESLGKYLNDPAGVDILFLNSAFTVSLPAYVEKIEKTWSLSN